MIHCLDCKIVLFESQCKSAHYLCSNCCVVCSFYAEGPGGHVSSYSFKWLTENSYQEVKRRTVQPRILWNKDVYTNANITSAKWDTFMKSDDELKTFLQDYLLYGIAFVDGVPATVEATEAVSQRVSLIRYVYAFMLHSTFHSPPFYLTCMNCSTGRRPMGKCGVLLQICPEETQHTLTWL